MGTSVSRNLDLTTNEYILKFVGKEPIPLNDSFWNSFLTFHITPPTTRNDQLALESRIESLCQQLLIHNELSGNFGTIIEIFLMKSAELLAATQTKEEVLNWQLFNNLFIIRCILKFLTETVDEDQLLRHIECDGNGTCFESLIGSLVAVLVDVPVIDATYAIHLEAVTILIILLSITVHTGRRPDQSIVYRQIMRGRHVIHAPLLMRGLLTNFVKQMKPSAIYGEHGHSIVLGIAAELWSILTFNRRNNDEVVVGGSEEFQDAPLAMQSLLLVLILANNWTTLNNPYRISLYSCTDSRDNNPVPPTKAPTLFKIDYDELYLVLCKKAAGDAATLLLYLLLHRNQLFKTYLLSRTDLDQLVIPILKTLYNAPHSNSHHIYMSLIILLILSEDDSFNKSIHETKLKNIAWYTERALTEISLGGLLVLVVIRTVQYNMLKMRDKYLHTNCLAALANMSGQFRNLHPYVSQRLISLFETLAKRYQRLVDRLSDEKRAKTDEIAVTVNQNGVDVEQDVGVLEEVLRMVLEILNSCLSNQLINNPNLVYTLLYNKHIFLPFKDVTAFKDVVHNIDVIIKYFSDLLSDKSQHYEVDANEVLSVIRQGTKYWPKDKLTKFPDLKFKYVEEDQPEEFFIPYIWALVNQQSILHWTDESSPILSAVC